MHGSAEELLFHEGDQAGETHPTQDTRVGTGSCHFVPSLHPTPYNLTVKSSALLEVFPMGSETSPEGRFCTLPASGAVIQPLEGDSRGAEAWRDERDPGL